MPILRTPTGTRRIARDDVPPRKRLAGRIARPVAWMAEVASIRPALGITLSFVLLIGVGTGLLMLPQSTVDGAGLAALPALFTATSAACVTGLSVLDVGSVLSRFGQCVLLGLIEVGGLGIMTLSSFFLMQIGQVTLRQLRATQAMLEHLPPQLAGSLMRTIVVGTVLTELAGAALLYGPIRRLEPDAQSAVFSAVFHSVSAFCNAGFGLYPDNLIPLRHSPLAMGTIMALITVGGIGFVVIRELWERWVRRRTVRLSVHTRLALASSAILVVLGAVLVYAFERDNPATLGTMGPIDGTVNALFNSVTTRTAGFNTVDMARLRDPTVLVIIAWMFIGGCPGSTAGGVKAVTVAVLFVSLYHTMLGRDDAVIFGRCLPRRTVRRALTLTVLCGLVVFGFSLALMSAEAGSFGFAPVLFEVTSAFGTVGLSLGITAGLSTWGQLLLVLLMLIGRLGPLTLATAVTLEAPPTRVRYAEERVLLG